MSSITPIQGKAYWRSLGELQDTPEFREFVHREFPVAASEFPEGVSRRRWMQLMGASLALGGLSGCRWQVEEIAPFAMRPENRIPGKPEYYATSIEIGGMPRHLLATCFDGRPVKIEGNPEHPACKGGTDVFAQASILGLYDPDRSDSLRERVGRQDFRRTWPEFERFCERHFAAKQAGGGQGLALLIEPTCSVTLHSLLRQFRRRFPQALVCAYSPLADDQELSGIQLAFGRPLRPRFQLEKAKRLFCLDADLLGIHAAAPFHARGFASGREPGDGMHRCYVAESQYSVTGAAADHRLPVPSHQLGWLLAHVDSLVRQGLGLAGTSGLEPLPPAVERFAAAVADDLVAHPGESLVAVGPGQPADVHALAMDLNATLGNIDRTVVLFDRSHEAPTSSLAELVAAMRGGEVDTLVMLGGNPVYDAPGALQFSEALSQVATTVRLGLYDDETSAKCTWALPAAHAFESWGDARACDGTLSVRQPLIEPLLNGKSPIEILGWLCDNRRDPQEIVRESIAAAAGRTLSQAEWGRLLHDGFLSATQATVAAPSDFARHRASILGRLAKPAKSDLELVFTVSDSVLDGRFANNGWLQEKPDSLTKLAWDNAAIVSPATASTLGVAHGNLVRLECHAAAIDLPVFVLPGQAAGSIGVALGYGRRAAGVVGGHADGGVASVGVDVNPLRTWADQAFTTELRVTPLGGRYEFATTQDHHAIDTVGLAETGRRVGELVREGTRQEYEEHPDFAQHRSHHNPLESLWKEPSYEGHAWGMAIDLNKCIGCSACVIACQAENNVPIVGKDQVAKGREMHWLRVDRYFQGDVDNPQVANQPVACHHCENAPCEQVCPVAATVHSDEGLNDMIYNRCVGTRYCANNCPYKVRRFNFFDYNKQLEEPNRQLAQLLINPEVTVRSRGVMEKCTYCVQRIQSVKIDAKNERRPILDGEIKTACQAACPTTAISFGDLNDPASIVSQAHSDPRAYGMLSELNVKPRTKYLARIRNPNPVLVDLTNSNHEEHLHGHS